MTAAPRETNLPYVSSLQCAGNGTTPGTIRRVGDQPSVRVGTDRRPDREGGHGGGQGALDNCLSATASGLRAGPKRPTPSVKLHDRARRRGPAHSGPSGTLCCVALRTLTASLIGVVGALAFSPGPFALPAAPLERRRVRAHPAGAEPDAGLAAGLGLWHRLPVRAAGLDAGRGSRRLVGAGLGGVGLLRGPRRGHGGPAPLALLADPGGPGLGRRRHLALLLALQRHALGSAWLRSDRHTTRAGDGLPRHRRRLRGRGPDRYDARLGRHPGPEALARLRRLARCRARGLGPALPRALRVGGRRRCPRGSRPGQRARRRDRHPPRRPPGDPQPSRRHDRPRATGGRRHRRTARLRRLARELDHHRPVQQPERRCRHHRGLGCDRGTHARRGDGRRPRSDEGAKPGHRVGSGRRRGGPLHQAPPGAVRRVHPVAGLGVRHLRQAPADSARHGQR